MTVELEIRREFSFFRQILAFSFYLNVTIGTQMVLSSDAIKELISLVFLFQGMPWGILPILHCLWSTIFPCVFGLLPNKTEAKSLKSPYFSEKRWVKVVHSESEGSRFKNRGSSFLIIEVFTRRLGLAYNYVIVIGTRHRNLCII